MDQRVVAFHDEPRCREIESFLVDRIYEFNVQATGYGDGRLLAATIQDDTGEVIAGINGHTWGGCCEIANVWVHERHRGQGLGTVLMNAAESEALQRGCDQVILRTHSFQAPLFYQRRGYERRYSIEESPRGHSDILYVKQLRVPSGADTA